MTDELTELAECVNRGADLLDERHPGWWNEINLDTFAMVDTTRCVLGQLYGHYADGRWALHLNSAYEEPADHGFNLHDASPGPLWNELDDLWRQAIEVRRP